VAVSESVRLTWIRSLVRPAGRVGSRRRAAVAVWARLRLGIERRPGHAQQQAHPGDLVVSLLRAGHSAPPGYGCVRAKKAAAFSGTRFPPAAGPTRPRVPSRSHAPPETGAGPAQDSPDATSSPSCPGFRRRSPGPGPPQPPAGCTTGIELCSCISQKLREPSRCQHDLLRGAQLRLRGPHNTPRGHRCGRGPGAAGAWLRLLPHRPSPHRLTHDTGACRWGCVR
jgi:hypothetical protein